MTHRYFPPQIGQDIRSLFSVGAMGALSDRELLDHFARRGDGTEPAFAALVDRHGAMVLRVCRHLLGDCDLAADSFQVTFLLLARRAESIRDPDALGGWLHRVARRVAARARAVADRKKHRERVQSADVQITADDPLERDEVRAIVHEEIDRLDDGLRLPILLCALEGLTHEEAARRLRWPVGTVKSRLVRGRRRLKGRLTRRGLAPAVALACASGAQASASLTVPLALAVATTRIAVGGAVTMGTATGPAGFTSSAAWLLRQELRAMTFAKLKLAAASMLWGAAVMTIGIALAGSLGERVQEPAVKSAISNEPKTNRSRSVPPAVKLSAHGHVVGADGRPVAGASVFIREWAIKRTAGMRADESEKLALGGEIADILARTTTDENGRFRFQHVDAPPFRHATVAGKGYYPWDLVAIAPGHGVAWNQLTATQQRTETILTLPAEGTLRGRLVEPGGKPIAGARIKVFAIYPLGFVDIRAEPQPAHLDLTWSSIPLVAASGADGTFTLRGLPREIQACLVVTHPHHERKVLYAATTSLRQPEIPDRSFNQGQSRVENEPVYPEDFTLRLKTNDHHILGRVVLEATGRPAAGTRVSWKRRRVVADADGRFVLENLPAGEIELHLVAPVTDAAPIDTLIILPEKAGALERTFTLPPGMVITGRAVDAESGAGIGDVDLMYRPQLEVGQKPTNIISTARTETGGRFRLAVPPGRGVLEVRNIPGPYPVPRFKASESNDEARFIRGLSGKAGDTLELPSYRLVRGKAIVLKVRDPEGRPVAGAEVVQSVGFDPDHAAARTDAAGRCELYGLDRENGFTLDVTHPTQPLGGRVVVRPDDPDTAKPDGTMEIKLEPCGSLTGRVLDDDGGPITFAVVRLYAEIDFPASPKNGLIITVDVRDDGTFAFDRLIAGVGYHINVLGDGHAHWIGKATKAGPGDAQDIGEIRLPWADQQVSGIVIDAHGQGIGGATVGYERDQRRDAIGPPMGCQWFQQTDAHGRFRLSGLPRGTIGLVAHRPAEGRSVRHMTRLQARAGVKDVRIVLPDVDERLRGIE